MEGKDDSQMYLAINYRTRYIEIIQVVLIGVLQAIILDWAGIN